ncbi:DUF2461 domain-containing protein [Microlunatus sp. Gsoil 973]|uniref:DUF2461 domain-containing protein n=1 Tax=Microlunatus sp. Gsoil 973 TaxID=2672569 RepID=UPI0012B456C8|nr:DUF2461 domain-containing protein [Microlunatus sp. Gsoil 973]QGN33649.1 TIGR02453 family protein [Microlunatus sp. Gsoil 973]
MTFEGFPAKALDFYDDLEIDNSKAFWDANKDVYTSAVQTPMRALTALLEPEFGAAKIFRPYRDVRFSRDKTPYKTHQGAFVHVADATGFYIEISARGVRTGAGFYHAAPEQLAGYRAAAAADGSGRQLSRIVNRLQAAGFEIGGDRLKTKPRGIDPDHPRLELLRHRSLFAGRMLGFDPVIHGADLVDVVRSDWQTLRPLVDWVVRHTLG